MVTIRDHLTADERLFGSLVYLPNQLNMEIV